MSKKIATQVVVAETVDIMKVDPSTLNREQLSQRYKNNVAERNRLSEENKVLSSLYKGAVSSEKKSSAEAKIAALTAKLEALRNPSPVVPVVPEVESPVSEEIAL
jgi:hypothetical protein